MGPFGTRADSPSQSYISRNPIWPIAPSLCPPPPSFKKTPQGLLGAGQNLMRILKRMVFCFKIHLFFQGSSAFLKRAIQLGAIYKDLRRLTILIFQKVCCGALTWLATVAPSQSSVCEFKVSSLPTQCSTPTTPTHTHYTPTKTRLKYPELRMLIIFFCL